MVENSGNRLFGVRAAGAWFGMDMIKFDDCARWVISQLHPDGISCPACSWPAGVRAVIQVDADRLERWRSFEQVRCPQCGAKFTAKTGTLLHGSKLEVREVYLIAVLTDLGVTTQRIAQVLRCHIDTVKSWQAHFHIVQGPAA